MILYLDFGHGGYDPGAVGKNGTKESDVVLKIGMMVKKNLEKKGIKTITTRQSDKYYSLSYRSSKANNNKCNYFISIHMNAASNVSAKGCEVWVYDNKSKVYNLAKSISSSISKNTSTLDRGVKVSKKFAVLKNTAMPALLIEVDFLSNAEIEKRLLSYSYLENVASSISSSILNFLQNI